MITLYFFTHVVRAWLSPPGLNILVGLAGFYLISARSKHWVWIGKAGMLLSFISLYLLSIPLVSQLLFKPLQMQYPVLQPVQLSKNSAILVLGGGNTSSPEYGSKLTLNAETVDRLRYAVFLYQKTHLPIIVSGGGQVQVDSEAALMKDVLCNSFHIPASMIWLEDKSINTADEAKYILPLLKQHSIQVMYLVTNAWHMPRSIGIFNFFLHKLQIKIIPAPMGYMMFSSQYTISDYLPSAQTLKQSSMAIEEYLGMLWYKIYYRSSAREKEL